jgi:hypothetical protein
MSGIQSISREEWNTLIEEYEKSNLTQKEFCEQNNVNLVRFGYYIQRLRKKTKNVTSGKPPSFSQVLLDQPQTVSEIKIELPNGFKCFVPLNVKTDQLKNILGALLSC